MKETGSACIPLVNTFADGHADKTLEAAKGRDVSFAGELEYLRTAWGHLTHSIAGAPMSEPKVNPHDSVIPSAASGSLTDWQKVNDGV